MSKPCSIPLLVPGVLPRTQNVRARKKRPYSVYRTMGNTHPISTVRPSRFRWSLNRTATSSPAILTATSSKEPSRAALFIFWRRTIKTAPKNAPPKCRATRSRDRWCLPTRTIPEPPSTHQFTAKIVPARRAGPPQRHEFTPTVFYRQFSAANKPVLTVSPGDTIHTTTVDAGGRDEKGVTRVVGGNPETGPFYIETAAPGDTLVVHLTRLRLNRDYAESDDFLVGRAVDSGLAVKMKDGGKTIRWHLDTQRGVATPEKPAEHLKQYTVPLRPMLGCVAVAPGSAQAAPGTGDSGRWGGNMDFNEIVEGATIYLPVSVAGRAALRRRWTRSAGRRRTQRQRFGNLDGRRVHSGCNSRQERPRSESGIGHANHGDGPERFARRRHARSHSKHGAMAHRRVQANAFRGRASAGHLRRIQSKRSRRPQRRHGAQNQ